MNIDRVEDVVMPILQVDGLTRRFGGLNAVDNACFSVEPQTITSLIGPNGAGKTTVFNLISGLLAPTSGSVKLRGKVISNLLPQTICHLGLGRTFQEPRVFGAMTVLENVMVGRRRQKGESLIPALLRTPQVLRDEQQNLERAMEILRFVGLDGRPGDLAQTLSYGQQRFLSIARVLAAEPEVLLLDEPTVGLHPEEIKRLMKLIVDMVKERLRTVLLIEHNMDVVMGLSDWVILLVQGTVVASGPPDEIKKNKTLLEAYLGASYSRSYADA